MGKGITTVLFVVLTFTLYSQIELINNKIGIGTATPQVALDLRGDELIIRNLSDQIRLAINSNGNVGIGTSNPTASLVVNGNNGLASLSSDAIFQLGISSGQNLAFDKNEIQGRNNGPFTDIFLQKNGGNVGIGTNTPSAKLDIVGNVQIDGISSGYSALAIDRAVGNPSIEAIGSNSANNHDDWLILDGNRNNNGSVGLNHYSTGSVILANGGGNVGVGVNSPEYNLDIKDNLRIQTSNQSIFRMETGDGSYSQSLLNNAGMFWDIPEYIHVRSNQNGNISSHFLDDDGTRVFYGSDGIEGARWRGSSKNLGIGTNNPATKLHVWSTADGNGNRYNSRHHLETTAATLSSNRTSVSLQASTHATDVDRNGKRFYARGADLHTTLLGSTSAFDARGSYSAGTHRSTGTTSALFGSYNLSQTYNHASVNGAVTTMYGSFNTANLNSKNTTNVTNAFGTYGRVSNSNSDILNFARGVFGEYRSNGTSGDITHANGVYGYVYHIGQNSTISNSYGLRSYTYLNHDGATIDNSYGVHSRIYRRKGTSNNAYL